MIKPKYILLVVLVAASIVVVRLFFSDYEIINYPNQLEGPTVAFGDSLVSGVGASSPGGFVSILSERIGEEIINLGEPGDTTRDGLFRLEKVTDREPRIAIILLGGNDFIRKIPKEETFANLQTMITTIQSNGAITVLLGVRGGIIADGYESDFKDLAKETGSIYVPNVLDGLFGNPEFMADGIHPNQKGYEIIADKVYLELLEVLD